MSTHAALGVPVKKSPPQQTRPPEDIVYSETVREPAHYMSSTARSARHVRSRLSLRAVEILCVWEVES